ncbi:MAG: G5 domain-containing protein, partial [Peptococcaceae bacterium]|nr:G5 domain-containing protein [Peptococcaceae bacterium]
RDATVVDNYLDFVFRNNTDNHIYIKTDVVGGQLMVKIYGNTADKREVQVNSWVTQTIPPQVVYENNPSMPKGEEQVLERGANGYRVAAERLFLKNGVVELREALHSSSYNPQKRVVSVGASDAEKPPTGNESQATSQNVASGGNQNNEGSTNTGGNNTDTTGGGDPGSDVNNDSNSDQGDQSDTDNSDGGNVNPGISVPSKPSFGLAEESSE